MHLHAISECLPIFVVAGHAKRWHKSENSADFLWGLHVISYIAISFGQALALTWSLSRH